MTPAQSKKIDYYYRKYNEAVFTAGGKDPSVGGRAKEYHLAHNLKHKIAEGYNGQDALNGKINCEYKTSVFERKNPSFRYNFERQKTLKKQIEYAEKKIFSSQQHYLVMTRMGIISEAWCFSPEQIWQKLKPLIENRDYEHGKNKIDVNITLGWARRNGKPVKV